MAENIKVVLPQMADPATAQGALALASGDIKQILAEQLERSFAAREAPDGETWKDLERLDGRPAKSRSKGGMKRGAMESILQGVVTALGFESNPAPLKASDAFHWRFQDRGARKKAKRTSRVLEPGTPYMAPPARPFYSVSEQTLEQCTERVADRLTEAMTR